MRVFLIAALSLCLRGETLQVFSEFTRVSPDGQIVQADRGAPPRHILSPGVVRNAHASFRIVVTLDRPDSFTLDVGQNPEDATKVSMYWEKDGVLTPVKLPFEGKGVKVLTFWMDCWVDRNAPVDRVKVEPQLYLASFGDWITYPMEVRILPPVTPAVKYAHGRTPPSDVSLDAAAFGPLRAALCGKGEDAAPSSGPLLPQRQIRRNVQEHLALADAVKRRTGKDVLLAAFLKATGEASIERWCASPFTPKAGPEWYLRLRDAIFRDAEQ